MKFNDRKFTFTDRRVRELAGSQKPAPTGRHFLVIKRNGDGRPCSFGKAAEFTDAVQVADEQWDLHGEVIDDTGKRSGCCYPGETVGEYQVLMVSSKPLAEQV